MTLKKETNENEHKECNFCNLLNIKNRKTITKKVTPKEKYITNNKYLIICIY